ncbi:endo-1,4-beta-xylanase [Paenibacillus tarimensis]
MYRRLCKRSLTFILTLTLIFPLLSGLPHVEAEDAVSIHTDFEDGTAQGWYGRGDTVAAVTEEAKEGNYSLKSTGRTAGWMGPGLNVTALAGHPGTYHFQAWVKLEAGETDAVVNVTMESGTPVSGSNSYTPIVHGTAVTAAAWTEISGTYSIGEGFDFLQIYFESPNPSLVFYIDEITFKPAVDPDQGNIVSFNDFEDGTLQGWGPRIGAEAVSVVTEQAYSGTHSMKIANRTASYTGASKDVTSLLTPGSTNVFSAWVKLAPGMPQETIRLTMQTNNGSVERYVAISFASVTSDAWTRIEGKFDYLAEVDRLSLYFEAVNAGIDFYADDIQIILEPDQGPLEIEHDIPSLQDVFADHFLMGTAYTYPHLTEAHQQLVRKHYNSITSGNSLKWDSTEPAENVFRWEAPDMAIQFAVDNNIQFRGHTLVWHQQTPDWVFRDANGDLVSKEVLYARMENHIKQVVGRYKGKIYAWDVVNEVIDSSEPDGLRRSLWYEIAGEEYIEKAFQFAREADPDAKLFINDFNTEDPVKAQKLYDLVKRLKDKGVPVDGVGHQFHVNIQYPSIANLEHAIVLFADLDVDQEVTELDMSVYTSSSQRYTEFTESMALEQADRYKEIFDVFLKHSDKINNVTIWGTDDGNTWLTMFPVARNNWPLLFDKRLQAKYAYWAIVDPSRLPVQTQRAKAYYATPAIDGIAELEWHAVKPFYTGSESFSFEYRTLWDEEHLYLWIDVTDVNIDEGDKVNVYIDQSGGETYTFHRNGAVAEGTAASISERIGGYVLEATIPFSSVLSMSDQIGFDIRLYDGSGSVLSWNDTSHGEPSLPANWGILELLEGAKISIAGKATPDIGSFDDAVWSITPEMITQTWVEGENSATASVRALWDEQFLYVQAKVSDPLLSDASVNPWEQDSVELFVDLNNRKTDSYEAEDGQYRVNFNNTASFGSTTVQEGFLSAAKVVEGGYIVEAAIPIAGHGLGKDSVIGFDVQVNDDAGGTGRRSGVVTWSDPTGRAYTDPSTFGAMKFVDEIPVSGIRLNKSKLNLKTGKTGKLKAKVLPKQASNRDLIWTSSDNQVAAVNADGLVTAVAAGNAVITVTTLDGQYAATAEVIVRR